MKWFIWKKNKDRSTSYSLHQQCALIRPLDFLTILIGNKFAVVLKLLIFQGSFTIFFRSDLPCFISDRNLRNDINLQIIPKRKRSLNNNIRPIGTTTVTTVALFVQKQKKVQVRFESRHSSTQLVTPCTASVIRLEYRGPRGHVPSPLKLW